MEKLINPEVPDKQISVKDALREIRKLMEMCPELKTMLRLDLCRIYNPDA